MRRFLIAVIALGILAAGASAQTKLAAFLGYGQSAFDNDDLYWIEDQAGYIPLGVQGVFELSPGLSIGAELNFAIVPFTWEIEELGEKIGENKVKQTVIGVLCKYEIGQGRMRPHLRGGAGMYMGGSEFTAEEGSFYIDGETDFKNAVGFNIGGGLTADWGYDRFWLAEFVYHIVEREEDVEDGESFGANNWAIQLGAGMKF